MLLSIIIPTKNEENNLPRLLNSILKNKYFDSKEVEILVVDNPKTTDKTKQIAENYGVKLFVKGPERSPQRNFGAENSTGKYLYFVDADMEFTDALLKEVLEICESSQNIIGIIPERIPGKNLYCRARNLEKMIYDNNLKMSAGRLFKKSLFIKVGGYNEEMVSGEDWELDKRLEEAGGKKLFLKNYIKHNEESMTILQSVRKKIYYAKKLKNYKVGLQTQINPLYRYGLFFSKPLLIVKNPMAFVYLITLKTAEFGTGFFVYKFGKK